MWPFTDVANLVLSRACVGCDAFGDPLCATCLHRARTSAHRIGSFAVGTEYRDIGRATVLAHKRQLIRALSEPLGLLLSDAIALLSNTSDSIALVPIPAHRAALRARGQDTVRAIAEAAARRRRAVGHQVIVQQLLIRSEERPSLAGATRAERLARVAGAFAMRGTSRFPIVVVDDVITTGATVREAMRTLAAGQVIGAAAVAGGRWRTPRSTSR